MRRSAFVMVKNSIIVILALAVVAFLVGKTRSGQALAAQISDVFVTNDAAHPVPVRPGAPASPWRAPLTGIGIGSSFEAVLAGPSASPINLTSLSASVDLGKQAVLNLIAFNVPNTATDCDSSLGSGVEIIFVLVNVAAPIAVPFPTPLQWAPPAGQKACLIAVAGGVPGGSIGGTMTVNASGFFGS